MAVKLNQLVPDFTLPSTQGKDEKLSDYRGKTVVLYFYPKDCTSGCTVEGQNFRDLFPAFKKLNAIILGVSRDSLKLHHKFKTEQNFPFDLLSDTEQKVCDLFDVMKEKSMYGKKYLGVERSTFLIDKTGKLIFEWRNVKIEGHVKDVLEEIKSARGSSF